MKVYYSSFKCLNRLNFKEAKTWQILMYLLKKEISNLSQQAIKVDFFVPNMYCVTRFSSYTPAKAAEPQQIYCIRHGARLL